MKILTMFFACAIALAATGGWTIDGVVVDGNRFTVMTTPKMSVEYWARVTFYTNDIPCDTVAGYPGVNYVDVPLGLKWDRLSIIFRDYHRGDNHFSLNIEPRDGYWIYYYDSYTRCLEPKIVSTEKLPDGLGIDVNDREVSLRFVLPKNVVVALEQSDDLINWSRMTNSATRTFSRFYRAREVK